MLAGEHMGQDPDMTEVYWAPAEHEVRLIEVSGSVGDTGEVLPFKFAPDPPDVPYVTVVVLLGRGDWERVKAKDLELPEGFTEIEQIAAKKIA